MITKDLRKLLERLNRHTTRALEAATGSCISRGHYEVALEHLFLKLIEDGRGDFRHVFQHFGVHEERLKKGLERQLEEFRAGNTGRPTFSPQLLILVENAWLLASVHHGLATVRSGTLLEAFLQDASLQNRAYAEALTPVKREELRERFIDIVAGSSEDGTVPRPDERAPQGETALDRYTRNFTQEAREGRVDPISGRDAEIRQIIDILSRRRKNNPILVGEAGVGKSAVVEGLALCLAAGRVPAALQEVDIHALDLGLLKAGASMKGEFEDRVKSVIRAVREAPRPVVLFIDEAHTLIGAGGAEGTGDAANLLKPALARGELRTVAATTWSEYKKYIEKDPALERRFQQVKVEEPSVEVATTMLRGIKAKYEAHHDVQITDAAVHAAAALSERYMSGRQLPDKAVDLLDTAAARVRMSQTARPPRLNDLDRQLHYLAVEEKALRRDLEGGFRSDDGLKDLHRRRTTLEERRAALEARYEEERALADRIDALQVAFADPAPTLRVPVEAGGGEASPDAELADDDTREDLAVLRGELAALQDGAPLVFTEVGEAVTAQVVSDWTGIPVGRMLKDEATALLALEEHLGARILGQGEALREVSEQLRTSKAGLGNPNAPLGVFLFVGPSGVGKTETALALADELFGGERFLTTINMSEYQEKHTASQLKGSPPGYVGYGEGGVLTEAVRRQPYSVVLLDEVEKAHRDVLNLFYQVFDRGFMRDGEGREINFENTVLIMTSNLGSEVITALGASGERPSPDEMRELIHADLVEHFQPALLGRMNVVPFYLLDRETMLGIARLKLARVGQRLASAHKMTFDYDAAVVHRIAERCTQVDAGARNIDFIIDRTVLPEASRALIAQMAREAAPDRLTLGLNEEGDFTYTFE